MLTNNNMHKVKRNEIKNYKEGTRSILNAAFNNNVEVYEFIKRERIFILKKGDKNFWIRGPRISLANPVTLWIIKDKFLTKNVLKELNIPHPQGEVAKNFDDAVRIAKKIKFPLVVKPSRYEGGIGVFLKVDSMDKVKNFFKKASKYDKRVLIEKYVAGKYFRITLVNNKIAGVLETKEINLTGDGSSTVRKLIEKYNKNDSEKYKITNKTKDILAFQNLNLNSKPKKNKKVSISFSGAEGGMWKDRTDDISKITAKLIEKMTKYLDLKVAGVDLITKDISLPINSPKSPGYILEINGAPEFIFHLSPSEGKSRDIGEAIIKMLFN
jgi:cyanophycin synthetase